MGRASGLMIEISSGKTKGISNEKILLLGGSAQQVIAITCAKRLGYYTVLCDYLPDNPGQYVADKFFLVSTTDKSAVLDIARSEHVDGVLVMRFDSLEQMLGMIENADEWIRIEYQ